MAICLQNIVWLCIAVIAVVLAVEMTRWHCRRDIHKVCRAICQQGSDQQSMPPAPPSVSNPPFPQQGMMRQGNMGGGMMGQGMMGGGMMGQGMMGGGMMGPGMMGQSMAMSSGPPAIIPINQITHGPVTDWSYVGYAFPKTGSKPGDGRRFPLFSRSNIYQKYGFDYYVLDDSRNRVRINIDMPPGKNELQSGDEIKITGETGKWIVNVDIPADTTWQQFLPAPGFVPGRWN